MRRCVLALALLAVSAALAVVAGWPDPGSSLDLVTGRRITAETELAFVALLCWLALAVVAVTALASAWRRRASASSVPRMGGVCLAALAVGAVLLAAGVVRHDSPYRVCCADQHTAQQAEQLVH